MEEALQLAVIFFAALATGALMVNWIGLGRAMSHLSAPAYVEFHQATNHTFDPYMLVTRQADGIAAPAAVPFTVTDKRMTLNANVSLGPFSTAQQLLRMSHSLPSFSATC
jgi:hypothetical protein